MNQQLKNFPKSTSLALTKNNFVVYEPKSHQRDIAEHTVKKCFRQAYQVDVSEFLICSFYGTIKTYQ